MKRRSAQSPSIGAAKADVTRELTGDDCAPQEAEPGNVGNGDPAGNPDDIEQQFRLEGDPAHPEDIPPDHLEAQRAEEEEGEYTARPTTHDVERPLTPDLLP